MQREDGVKTHREKPPDDRGRDWSVRSATCQRARIASNRNQEEGVEQISPSAFIKSTSLLIPRFQTSGLQNWKNTFLLL